MKVERPRICRSRRMPRPGELLLLVSPQVVMDLGDAIQRALRAYLNATKGNV